MVEAGPSRIRPDQTSHTQRVQCASLGITMQRNDHDSHTAGGHGGDDSRDSGGLVEAGEDLPDNGILSIDEYLAMQRAIGERTRFRIVRDLRNGGEKSPTQLSDDLDVASSNLHHHLNKLVEVGLIEKRERNEADEAGLLTYYRLTPMGEMILDHGVEELIEAEQDIREAYA